MRQPHPWRSGSAFTNRGAGAVRWMFSRISVSGRLLRNVRADARSTEWRLRTTTIPCAGILAPSRPGWPSAQWKQVRHVLAALDYRAHRACGCVATAGPGRRTDRMPVCRLLGAVRPGAGHGRVLHPPVTAGQNALPLGAEV
ncbi:hypothetical protein BDY21DRAFT_357892 [Lineolata rhizophorae]|uniref:Uncharacterized protein n=1 Tax=Lineolata rhizophorae TaxID=578093 RepID=A0A6A6NMK0_9PEZI|nr:hypothetical protein BDY21DRAFT_357892 [Lineolata rhizophorae]